MRWQSRLNCSEASQEVHIDEVWGCSLPLPALSNLRSVVTAPSGLRDAFKGPPGVQSKLCLVRRCFDLSWLEGMVLGGVLLPRVRGGTKGLSLNAEDHCPKYMLTLTNPVFCDPSPLWCCYPHGELPGKRQNVCRVLSLSKKHSSA